MAIDFYLDFISSFGYLARGRLVAIAQKFGQTILYHPVDIQRLRLAAGNTGPSNSAIPAKLKYMTTDFLRWADLYGLKMVRSLSGAATGVFNRGVYLAIERNQADAYVEHAWDCIWRDGLDPGATSSEAELEARMGWQAGELNTFANTPVIMDRYSAQIEAASRRGVFGVPTFMIGEHMWWGNDRLDFLERHLRAQ
jgi:2-hydroxychromene-2-carboxylate isomerase